MTPMERLELELYRYLKRRDKTPIAEVKKTEAADLTGLLRLAFEEGRRHELSALSDIVSKRL